MKFALASTLFATAAAFAPVQNANVNSALNAFANGYVGNEGPEPMPFAPGGTSVDFDPCGFAEVSILYLKICVGGGVGCLERISGFAS